MKCSFFRNCVIFLSVFVVFSQAQDDDCWVYHNNHKHSNAKRTNVIGNKRCKSVCSDLNQLRENKAGGCNAATTYSRGFSNKQLCRIEMNDTPPNNYLYFNKYFTSYVMKDACKYRSCWNVAERSNQKLGLKEVASLTEKQCKFRCMETRKCYHVAFTNNKCYIQYWNTMLNSVSSKTIGTIYRVDKRCKDERCWEIFYDEVKAWTTLVNRPEAKGEFNCREYCLIIWSCNVFIWKYGETDIKNRCWVMEEKIERNYNVSIQLAGVNSWVMFDKCRDWNSAGYYLGD